MEYSLQEAADAAGVSKSTIHRAHKSGKLSKNANGKIDASELARVYPNSAKIGTDETFQKRADGTVRHGSGTANETTEIKVLEVKLEAAETLATDREKTIEHLRSELEDERQERRSVQTKLTALLTDQRPAKSVAEPAPPLTSTARINYPLWGLVVVGFGFVIWFLATQG